MPKPIPRFNRRTVGAERRDKLRLDTVNEAFMVRRRCPRAATATFRRKLFPP
jgi:hypothetical protein